MQKQKSIFANGRWLYTLPLLVLVVLLMWIQTQLRSARAAGYTRKSTTDLVQLGSDPYTNTGSDVNDVVYHQTEYEPASYAFGSTIVSTFQVGRFQGGGSTNLGWATSADAGQDWHTGLLSGITTYAGGTHARVSNASVAYDPKDHVWLIAYLLIDNTIRNGTPAITSSGVAVSRSLDGGVTWNAPVIVSMAPSGDDNGYDKPWISCDTSVHSPFYGHCYLLWNDIPQIDLSTSTDGGATWGAITHSTHSFNGIGGQLVVQPNGTVVVVTPDDSDTPLVENLVAFTSTDGGQSWGSPVSVSTLAGFFPSLTEDAQGTLYVVASGTVGGGSFGSAAYLARSTDGLHWTAPQTLLSPAGANISYDHLALAANSQTEGTDTHLGLTYYVTDYSASLATMQAFFVSSTDAGQHWNTAAALSVPMSADWLVSGGRSVGDYISTVFSEGRAFPFFVIGTERGSNDPYHQGVYTLKEGIGC